MAYAFAGAHRTGKTTLAKMIAEGLGLHYIDCGVTEELKRAGFDQVANLDLKTRLACQAKRLELHMEKFLAAPRPSIFDRTPLDIAAYTMAEFTMHSDPELGARAKALADECVRLTNKHYDTVILLPPLPAYQVEEGKPPMNLGFQWHIHWIVEGLIHQTDAVVCAKLTRPGLDDRYEAANGLIAERMDSMREWREANAALIH